MKRLPLENNNNDNNKIKTESLEDTAVKRLYLCSLVGTGSKMKCSLRARATRVRPPRGPVHVLMGRILYK